MRNYEFTVIFNSLDELTAKGMEFVSETFKEAGVEITKQEDMGIKFLAYPIKKQDKGHYFYFEMNADPSKINEFSRLFLLSAKDSVLKFLFVAK